MEHAHKQLLEAIKAALENTDCQNQELLSGIDSRLETNGKKLDRIATLLESILATVQDRE